MASLAEIVALVTAVAAVLAVVTRTTRGSARTALVTLLLATALAAGPLVLARGRAVSTPPSVPKPSVANGYVTSAACRSCHPAEHASFARTYHRTMTQVASPASVLAPLDGRALALDDRTVRLEARGQEVWATLPDPDGVIELGRGSSPATAEDVTRRVLLTTGSHREQAFWVAGKRSGDLRLVPFVWLVREAAFVARRDAFLTPPEAPLPPVRWGSSCIACHAVGGSPRHDLERDVFDTRVAELGVACEACHGPGAAHVDQHRDPIARYMQRRSDTADPTIVHPRRISPERSAAICGQCHAYAFPRDENDWWTDGYAKVFRAGDLLDASRTLITPQTIGRPGAPVIDAPANAIFWDDGAVRVGGREYNGLVASPCWERGHGERKMTCLSCHAMHDGDPRGQIAPDRSGDRGCTGCHTEPKLASPAHTHHPADSIGSACVSCHMPKTSYALLSAVRSHRIDSPRSSTLDGGKPNACNLCHLDRPLAWTADRLAEWYGQPARPGGATMDDVPSGLRIGLAGDAGARALVADALGSEEATQAVAGGPGFQVAVLESMRQDPYAAVRFIVERSLRARRGAGGAAFVIDPERVRALLALRDDRAITIAE